MASTTPDVLGGRAGGSPPTRQDNGRPGSQARLVRRTMLALVVPSIILVILINAYPFVYAANQSLHDGTLINAGSFVGFGNYHATLVSSAFWQAAEFTLLFTVVGVFGSWAVGLALALLLRTRLPGRGVFKVLLLLPWIVPTVVSATSWNYLVATPQSPIVELSGALGFGHPLFLANAGLAKLTVCLFKVWISFPFMMLMTSAALASVDHSVYEAARMDGASSRQQFTNITLPIIARSTYISWILMTIFCVNDFPTIYLLTGGGPVNATTSLVVLAYEQVFKNYQVGSGVSIAFIMTLTLILISVLLYRQIRKAAV
jgi:multiple sugar transport system permease protein